MYVEESTRGLLGDDECRLPMGILYQFFENRASLAMHPNPKLINRTY